jgi:alanine dehydrogenase
MPGSVPRTSTPALAIASLPYGLALGRIGWAAAAAADPGLRASLTVAEGRVRSAAVAEAHGLPLAGG